MDKCLTNLELQAINTRQQAEAINQTLWKLGDGHIFDTICSHTNPCFCVAVKAAHVFNDITESFLTTYKTLRIIQKKTCALRHSVPGDTDCSLVMTEERVVNDCHTTSAKCNNAPIDLIKPHSAAVPLCVSVVQLIEAQTLSVTHTSCEKFQTESHPTRWVSESLYMSEKDFDHGSHGRDFTPSSARNL